MEALSSETKQEIFRSLRLIGYTMVEATWAEAICSESLFVRSGLMVPAVGTSSWEVAEPELLKWRLSRTWSRFVCVSGLIDADEGSVRNYGRTAEELSAIGAALKQSGRVLCYHNRDFEFAPLEEGLTGMDLLLRGFDPAMVRLCVDVGHAARAGVDPVAFIRNNGERVAYVHLRDIKDDQFVPLGTGELDLPAIMREIQALPSGCLAMVELDSAGEDVYVDFTTSYRYVQHLLEANPGSRSGG